MRRLPRALLLTLGLGAAAALVGQFNAGTTRAVGIDSVQVINSASNPVPVTGAVTATQSGPWKVGINGTPTVNVASAPPVNVNFPSSIGINGTVPVQNAPGLIGFTPFVVQDFENPARTAFQATCQAGGVGAGNCTLLTVPANKIAVIETVTGVFDGSASGPIASVLDTSAGGIPAEHALVPMLLGATANFSVYAFNAPVRIYADPASSVAARYYDANGSVVAAWTISGHFVCTNYQQIC